ncbi:pyrroline-5-carboxylate reductase [Methylobacterium nonmethylotrophicum]|uniref:Pyrroline-5-carboxylate reductase n=1 Tax=Methylobacterium nonmethylotrophicum TaxID=1141884 RepID=A0A4Z0P080_9HYPH|nr:pyrroline-5-carboxylate reductase [Methylobacterium nonmethylotrophicum]TGE02553.1 pyrroline-5-carboxylate reductase [Methylobacterium nonmethylotrophicum]
MSGPAPGKASLPASLVLVGAGKMGGALLEGWLADGLPGARVAVIDPSPAPAMAELCAAHGVALNPASPAEPEALVLAIKPQGLEAAAAALAPLVGPETLVVSVLAGKTIADLKTRLPRARAVVRAMPNLPASIRRGATGAAASPETREEQRRTAHALLAGVGLVEWLEGEELIDAVTAVSGSGPAYVFLLAEALAAAGVAAGLPAEVAGRLARQTVAGAGELLGQSPEEAATLRRNVTSPGGTTAAALGVLMAADGLEPLMRDAVAAAKRRAEELAG